jgi:protein phosphatase
MKAFVLVGAPGAGKSTYAKKLAQANNAVIISGDDIRSELFGSAEIQGNWAEIWSRIDELVSEAGGVPIVLDGTHYREDYRAEVVTLLSSYGYTEIEAVVVNPSLATCLARNFTRRDRNVPDYVVKGMYEKLQKSLKHIDGEPFAHITYVL